MGAWAKEHWFLTFLIIGGILFTVRFIVDANRATGGLVGSKAAA